MYWIKSRWRLTRRWLQIKLLLMTLFQVIDNGIGYWANGEGRSRTCSYPYYCHISYPVTNGGKVRATNGNNLWRFWTLQKVLHPTEINHR